MVNKVMDLGLDEHGILEISQAYGDTWTNYQVLLDKENAIKLCEELISYIEDKYDIPLGR